MTTQVTKNLLTFCYHCEDAYRCTTEEQCKACWATEGFVQEEEPTREWTTEELLREYAM